MSKRKHCAKPQKQDLHEEIVQREAERIVAIYSKRVPVTSVYLNDFESEYDYALLNPKDAEDGWTLELHRPSYATPSRAARRTVRHPSSNSARQFCGLFSLLSRKQAQEYHSITCAVFATIRLAAKGMKLLLKALCGILKISDRLYLKGSVLVQSTAQHFNFLTEPVDFDLLHLNVFPQRIDLRLKLDLRLSLQAYHGETCRQ
jgi:hypothetical protein